MVRHRIAALLRSKCQETTFDEDEALVVASDAVVDPNQRRRSDFELGLQNIEEVLS